MPISSPRQTESEEGISTSDLVVDISRLAAYLKSHQYAGCDPYDGLESAVFKASPFRYSKWARLAMIQAVKRSPVNLRWLLGVPDGRNPKGIALCVSAWTANSQADEPEREESLAEVDSLLDYLKTIRIEGYPGRPWGYNFSWQSRSFYAPRGLPNAICTIFAAQAFLDAFEQTKNVEYLAVAREASEFLLACLKVEDGGELHFRYIPTADSQVHNVNLLAAALLARLAMLGGNPDLPHVARRAISFSVKRQRPDGSWPYGEAENQAWVDNYHTGFNLVALRKYREYSGDDSVSEAIARGYRFWDGHFFGPDGAPAFYANQLYPIDVHCVAQSILTYLEFAGADAHALDRCFQTYAWARKHLQAEDGTFFFQKHEHYTIKISYVRWGQAWMFLALTRLRLAMTEREPVALDRPSRASMN